MPQKKKAKLCPNNPDHLIPMTIGDNCLSCDTPVQCTELYDNLKIGRQGKIGLDKE